LFVAHCVGDVAWLKLAGMLLQFLTYDKFDEVILRFLFLVSSSGPSAMMNLICIVFFSGSLLDTLLQVPLLDVLLQVPLLEYMLFEMNADICRRLGRSTKTQKFIPYPPQPYLLTCPQVFYTKTFKN
jgi:hypothetical protein